MDYQALVSYYWWDLLSEQFLVAPRFKPLPSIPLLSMHGGTRKKVRGTMMIQLPSITARSGTRPMQLGVKRGLTGRRLRAVLKPRLKMLNQMISPGWK